MYDSSRESNVLDDSNISDVPETSAACVSTDAGLEDCVISDAFVEFSICEEYDLRDFVASETFADFDVFNILGEYSVSDAFDSSAKCDWHDLGELNTSDDIVEFSISDASDYSADYVIRDFNGFVT